jgi:hypothetical protein
LADISGTVYHDANANNALDIGEIGVGDLVWVKLIQSGVVIQVLQPDSETGAYTFSALAAGSYTVIVDDNNLVADSAPTTPINWVFQNPGTGSLGVILSGTNVTSQDLGLVYDLGGPCACGGGDGMPTLTTITLDGNMADWALVLSDEDNNARQHGSRLPGAIFRAQSREKRGDLGRKLFLHVQPAHRAEQQHPELYLLRRYQQRRAHADRRAHSGGALAGQHRGGHA